MPTNGDPKMSADSIALIVLGLVQVAWVLMLTRIFQLLDKLEDDKQDKIMCAQKSAEIDKALGRGDAKFAELMVKFDNFANIFSTLDKRLALVVQQLDGIERRRKVDE